MSRGFLNVRLRNMKHSPQGANCRSRIVSKPCPMRWDQFWKTGDESIRHCDVCSENVHYCKTDAEAIDHARAGHCVAIEMVDSSELPEIMIGRPSNPLPYSEEQEESLRIQQSEFEKNRALKDVKFANRYCDRCGFPIASFRKHCWVCAKTEPGEQASDLKPNPASS